MLKRLISATVAAALLSACGGGGASQSTPPVSGNGGSGTLAVTITVPGSSTQIGAKRHPLYTSRDTKGMGVEFKAAAGGYTGAPSTTPQFGTAITAGSAPCGTAATNGSFSCTIYIPGVAVGYNDLRVTLWNGAPTGCVAPNNTSCSFGGAGVKALSFQVLPNQAIVAGINNQFNFTALPVVDSASVVLSAGLNDGIASVATAYLTLKDASGDIILGADQLIDASGNNLTVTLDIANDLGAGGCMHWNSGTRCSLSFNSLAQPSFTTAGATGNSVVVSYDGARAFPPSVNAVTTTTTGAVGIGSNVTVPLQSAANVVAGNSYTLDTGANQETVQVASISGLNAVVYQTTKPHLAGVAFASLPLAQVTIGGLSGVAGTKLNATFTVTQTNGAINVPAAPQYTSHSASYGATPAFLVQGSDYKLYANVGTALSFFTPCTPGPCALTAAIPLTGANIGGIASGADTYLWYTDNTNHHVVAQPPGAVGSPLSSSFVFGAETLGEITAGPDGNMWFLDLTSSFVDTYAPGALGTDIHNAPNFTTSSGLAAGALNSNIAAGVFSTGEKVVCFSGGSAGNEYVNCINTATKALVMTAPGYFIGSNVINVVKSLAFGSDGNLYVGYGTGPTTPGQIVSLALSGATLGLSCASCTYNLTGNGGYANSMTLGADDAVWFTEFGGTTGNVLGRVSPELAGTPGVLTDWNSTVQLPAGTTPNQILLSYADGKLWMLDTGATNFTVDQVTP